MKRALLALLALAAAFMLAMGADAALKQQDWPNRYHDLNHSSLTNASVAIDVSSLGLLYVYTADDDTSSPAVGDIDLDGKAEIVFSSVDGKLYSLDSGFNELWKTDLGCVPTSPTLAELSGDGIVSILVGCSDNNLYSYSKDGKRNWVYPSGGPITEAPVAVNIDITPEKEVVFVSGDRSIHILSASGSRIRTCALLDSGLSMPAVSDIDGDGTYEVLVGSADNRLQIASSSGPTRWFFDTKSCVSHPTAVGAAGTNKSRIAISTCDGRLYKLYYVESTKGSTKKCIGANCTIEPIKYSSIEALWELDLKEGASSGVASASLDKDREYEFVVGTAEKTLYFIDHNGSVMKRSTLLDSILVTPAAADFDRDNLSEIVVGTRDGTVNVLNASAYRRWSYDTGKLINKPCAIADLERDGTLEIIQPASRYIYFFGGNASVNQTSNQTTSSTTSSTSTTLEATTTTSSTTSTSRALLTACFDSDGLNASTKGIVAGVYDDKNYTYTDYCSSGVLVEYVCIAPEGLNVPDLASIPCPIGQSCVDGACIEDEATAAQMKEEVFDRNSLRGIVSAGIVLMLLLQSVLIAAVFAVPALSRRSMNKTIKELQDYKKDLKVLDKAQKT